MLKFQLLDLIKSPFLVLRLMWQHLKFKHNVLMKKYFYGDHKKQYLLFYLPKKVTKQKIIFFVNGSGWTSYFMFIYQFIGSFLGTFGYSSVIACHRFAPKYTYPSQIDDIVSAIEETLKIAEKNQLKKELILMGFSSGAQIVCLLAYSHYLEQHGLSKEYLYGVLSISGPINFYECKNKRICNVIKNYVGTLANKESADPYSHLVTNNLIPILCIHDVNDPIVEVDNSKSFIEKVNQIDPGKGELVLLKNYLHDNMLRIFLFPNYNQKMMKWLDQMDGR